MKNPFQAHTKSPQAYYELQPSELESIHSELRVLDVREPHEWSGELGHLSFAELAPLGSIEATLQPIERNTPLLFVCRSGVRSARAATLAVSLGFVNVGNLSGGMLAVRASTQGHGSKQ